MGKDEKGIQYYLEKMVEMSDVIDTSDIFHDGDIEFNISIKDEEYNSLLRHFRKMDWDSEKFSIEINNYKFNFSIKK